MVSCSEGGGGQGLETSVTTRGKQGGGYPKYHDITEFLILLL